MEARARILALTIAALALVHAACSARVVKLEGQQVRHSHEANRAGIHVVRAGASSLEVTIPPRTFPVGEEELLHWVESAAEAVEAYYGGFPVPCATITIRAAEGRGVQDGVTVGRSCPTITIDVGRDTTRDQLRDDWIIVHELVHLGFPNVEHAWLEEGIATYVEPIARARIGALSPERVWGDLVRDAPQGLPKRGDRGLDHTPTHARIYWGGAIFCLVADVEIRRRTANVRGLEDALRGITAHGGTIRAHWTMDEAIEAGDRATGVPVLRELYEKMRDKPVRVDLEKLWRELGVQRRGRRIVFDDAAPLASVRRAILRPEGR